MTQVIAPTPGRIVWYHPAEHDGIARLNGNPLSAQIAGIHNERLVNLAVLDAYGNWQQRSQVELVQPDTTAPNHAHATWMPYQVGQAAKTEAAEAALTAQTDAADIGDDAKTDEENDAGNDAGDVNQQPEGDQPQA